jgi:hypothetical protein
MAPQQVIVVGMNEGPPSCLGAPSSCGLLVPANEKRQLPVTSAGPLRRSGGYVWWPPQGHRSRPHDIAARRLRAPRRSVTSAGCYLRTVTARLIAAVALLLVRT